MDKRTFLSHFHTVREGLLLTLAIVCVIAIGTFGYAALEGWSLFDSLYMTVITLSTVGFSETHVLSEPGRWFTIFLIFVGVGVVMVVLTSAANKILERELRWIWRGGHMRDKIQSTSEHTIFCGFGRLAQVAINDLHEARQDIVVIDQNEESIRDAEERGILGVIGDATQDSILIEAGIQRASRLVSLLPKDADNLYVILAARELNPNLFTITRAEYAAGEKRLKQAGANRIVSPYRVGGQKIADGLLRPHVMDFLELAASGTQGDLFIEEIFVPHASPLCGKTLQETDLRAQTDIIIAAIISPEGETHFNPTGSSKIIGGSTLIALGKKSDFHGIEMLILPESTS